MQEELLREKLAVEHKLAEREAELAKLGGSSSLGKAASGEDSKENCKGTQVRRGGYRCGSVSRLAVWRCARSKSEKPAVLL